MKKLSYIILALLGLVSCKKSALYLTPETSLSSSSFYKTEAQFDQALTGAYTNLRLIAFAGNYMDEMRSDNTFFTFYPPDRGTGADTESILEFIDNANTSALVNSPGDRYGNDFSGIAKTNTILGRLASSSLSQSVKDRISGEALFLRAFYYFDLVQHYGGVPLQLKELIGTDGAYLPRNTVAEVYMQITTDLNAAVPILPVAKDFPQSGRATQGAAKILLAYAYMSGPTKDYAKAESALKDITKMNYALINNYADVFDPTKKNGKESIFEVQYQEGNNGQQSDFAWRFSPRTSNAPVLFGVDGNNAGGGLRSGGWNVPTQEMVDSYESGDLRLPASIAVAEGTVTNDVLKISSVKSPVGYTPTVGQDFRYFVKKYLHPPYAVQFNTGDNWPVFRYSGALLLLAECLVDESKNGEALPYLNQVRARAGLPAVATATAQNVANEMRHELAFENHRWTDLIRYGTAIEVLNAKGVTMKKLYGFLLPGTFNVTADRLLYAIPFREIQLNSQLTQNPGY
ncbi:RagB/SusD family nutrient uptake outer membrane protein [Mucilaginibacter sp. KACC 22773]|uniref:RagB/SusD family nutrient uptake outer membrane protein n=1 Tax=Mucilaginibacter sp. KACC 22773 TaxID=3025671 RepID=UPI002365E7B0|nr:RagB/SusD family nutrient uptake outer membrane protein [Mucilaginibacter sp. KACC 22773]WDF77121.1 RagB/SusD family nutrient uptake outer membrane protein [Mucilaginibacter sp. KACC 22773]